MAAATVSPPPFLRIEIPPLSNGDHLTRDEFERRYEAMPHIKKAELIEGVVHISSPVNHEYHGNPHGRLITWLCTYEASTPGVVSSDNATVKLDEQNEPQPDGLLMILADGQAAINKDGYIVGAPELVVEISASSASYDSHEKLVAYRRNGVREYIIWRVLDGELDWFVLHGDTYEMMKPDDDGLLRSQTFPGLWLDGVALLEGEFERVLQSLQDGIGSDAHREFCKSLSK